MEHEINEKTCLLSILLEHCRNFSHDPQSMSLSALKCIPKVSTRDDITYNGFKLKTSERKRLLKMLSLVLHDKQSGKYKVSIQLHDDREEQQGEGEHE